MWHHVKKLFVSSAVVFLNPQLQTAATVSLRCHFLLVVFFAAITQQVGQRRTLSTDCVSVVGWIRRADRVSTVFTTGRIGGRDAFSGAAVGFEITRRPSQGHGGLPVLQVSLRGSSCARTVAAEAPRLELPRGKTLSDWSQTWCRADKVSN